MPSFSIEVPGEANPLTEQILVNTLHSAASSDPHQIQVGTKQLQEWEKASGFYKHLQSAFLDQRLPTELRYLAIIQLKNGIDKYWRKTAQNAVSKNDKDAIRSRLVQGVLDEPNNRLALQSALVVAKIARYEFPNEWPDAVSGFVENIKASNSTLRLSRALLALLHIVKELSSARLIRSRNALQAAAPGIIEFVGDVYARLVDQWQTSPEQSTDQMQQSLLAIKLVRRLLITGYDHPNRQPEVLSFWTFSIERLDIFIGLRNNGGLPAATAWLLDCHIVQLAKLHHAMAKDHAAAFALLPGSMQLAHSYWGLIKDFGHLFGSREAMTTAFATGTMGTDGDATDEKPILEKIALKGLLLLRACVKMVHNPAQTFRYRTPEDKEEKNKATALVRDTLLSETFVREIMETLVTRFFVFRASDLREWLEEPEEWEKREEGEGQDWEFSIRSCSEKLFLDLAINYKVIIVQPLLAVFYSTANPANEDVLFKDSVYTAIGLAAPVLCDHLDFDAFIRDVLVAEVQKATPGYNVIRRRAAILLGQWINIKVGQASKPMVYQIFQHLLNHEDPLNDQVVRVTAGRQLLNVINSWEFTAEQFMPYAQTVLTQLMQLIEDIELVESKMAILNTISVIVERMEHNITPYAERIVLLLPGLWEQSGEEHLMKQSILTILARLVNAMKSQSLPLHSMVFPIIKGAVEPDSDSQVYLLEDALDLWSSVLNQSISASPELLDLVQYLFPIYELGSENLRKALEITDSYILLAPDYILSEKVRTQILVALGNLVGTTGAEASGQACNLVEGIVREAQKLGGESGVTQVATDLSQSGLLSKILQDLRGSWTAHCTTGPRAERPPVDGILETDYFAILARLAMGSMNAFCPDAETAKWLLEEWFLNIESIGNPARRKLMCLAVTKFLNTNQPWILINLQSLMSTWADIVTELREDAADVTGDSLVYNQSIPGEGETAGPEAPEDARRRDLTQSDDVHNINLPQWIKHHLQLAIEASGGEQQFQEQWLVNVDKDVLKTFSDLGIM